MSISQRNSRYSPPTNSNGFSPLSGGSKDTSNIERKLELLEKRFTMPPPGHVDNRGSPMNPLTSPPASEHSFAFGTPASTAASVQSQMSSASNLPSSSIRAKRRSSASATLNAVSLAAERHMRRVAASSPKGFLHGQELSRGGASRSRSSALSMSHSTSSISNQTMRTSHVRDTTSVPTQVVKESPPAVLSPVGVKPHAARNLLQVTKDKRKSVVPVKRELPTVQTMQMRPPNDQNKTTPSRNPKRTRLHFPNNTEEKNTNKKLLSPLTKISENNSRSNHDKPSKVQKGTGPTNNTLIDHFFTSAITKKPVAKKKEIFPASPGPQKSAFSVPQSNHLKTAAADSVPKRKLQATSSQHQLPDETLEQLRQKCQQLEKLCKDKDDQLKAVSNNRTIMHTAIQTALKKRETELEELKKSKERQALAASKEVEELFRAKASGEAKELREQLATNSARLGRIAYTRAGMRSMETWEEGHASRQLHKRRSELYEKQKVLEERQKVAKQATKQFLEGNKENKGTKIDLKSTPIIVAGITIKNELDAMEAVESVRLHLANIRRQLRDVDVEEQMLNDEKVVHIRALKRVASEDSSRFRKKPKLHNRYVLSSLLGKGGFSEVWRAYDIIEYREVAVKIHQLDPRWPDTKKENYTKHVSREYEIHRNVRHPRIVSLYDVFEIDTDSFATVLECCNGTDLDTLLKKQRRLPERDARAILLQILSGVNYLSHPAADGTRQGIIHYDLKPGNILFDKYGDAKITDFGLSKIVDAHDPAESMELTSQGAGTYWYLPPECFVMTENVRISNKVDVWSVGVIFFQMLFGKRPFGEGQSQDKLLTDQTMLNARAVQFPDKPKVSELAKQFVRECLSYDQALRPSVAQMCKHPYVVATECPVDP